MVKQILMYGLLYDESVIELMEALDQVGDDDVSIRVNTPGGDVYSTYGIIAKFAELSNKKVIQVDGIAASMGAFVCCYADDVVCLDVSTFLFHRAAYPSWIERSEYFTEDMKASLVKVNKDLRAAMEGKFTADKWQQVTKSSLDDLFSMDSRIDVQLTAKQAKQLGLVSNIKQITPEKKAEIKALSIKMAAMHIPDIKEPEAEQEIITDNPKIQNKMTSEQIKTTHPDAYKTIFDAGIAAEKDRVGAFMAFNDIDPEAVAKGIEGGGELSRTAMAEFMRKGMAKSAVADVIADNPAKVEGVAVESTTLTPEKKAAVDFEAEVRANLGLK